MGMFVLLLSNLEYIGLILAIVTLISSAKISVQRRKWIEAFGLLVILTVLPTYISNVNLRMILFIIGLLALVKVVLIGVNRRTILDVLIAVILIGISTQLVKMLLQIMSLSLQMNLTDTAVKLFARLILWMFVLSVYLYIARHYPAELKNIPLKYMIIFMIVLMADCISITFFGEYVLDDIRLTHGWIAELAYVLMGLGVFVQLGLLIALYFSRNAYRTQQALATKYLEEQVAHYQYLSEREQNTKRFRHDFKSHMAMAKQLYEEGKREEFEAYFHKMTEQIAAIGNRVTVNNDIADAIINRYYDEAALAGITMEVEGHFPGECYVSAYDLCTVLSNLLSNI